MIVALVIENYLAGKITAGHTAVELLHMIDPVHPEQVLQGLPTDILIRIQGFTNEFRPHGMVTNYGVLPAEDQVEAARKWIDANLEVHRKGGESLTVEQ